MPIFILYDMFLLSPSEMTSHYSQQTLHMHQCSYKTFFVQRTLLDEPDLDSIFEHNMFIDNCHTIEQYTRNLQVMFVNWLVYSSSPRYQFS